MCGGGGGGGQITETADMIEQEKINKELWTYYQESYKPLIDKYVERVTSPEVKKLEEAKVAGQVRGEVMRNIDPSKVSPNPIATEKQLLGLAKAETGMQVQGQGGVRSRQLGEMQNIIDIGRGQETSAQAGLGEIASQSLRSEISSQEIQQKEQAAVENAYGSVAGAVAAGLLSGGEREMVKNPKTGVRQLSPRFLW